ncbi:hypothetical protein DPMN_176442 [Dreissena polymorpha]|uniref:Uncharacterized protein n=1 Tax=Dreissena polymorpha TaxID=45954 RepID=A0A9D4EA49_DREPO|nr:hypothetical protein DPMN_176442 [Dreissena polymorpha]
MYIDKIHRIGSFNDKQTRPIIVRFQNERDIEDILANAYKLKGTKYGINRDYPKEITQARARLWNRFKQERANNPKGSVHIGYPAKLIVQKTVLQDEFPDWKIITQSHRTEQLKTSETVTKSPVHKTPSNPISTSNRYASLPTESDESDTGDDSDSTDDAHATDQYSQSMIQMEAHLNRRHHKPDDALGATSGTQNTVAPQNR